MLPDRVSEPKTRIMKFPAPIQKGVLVRRYKRFLADIELDGEIVTAHCANPGAMTGVKQEGATVWVSKALNPKRKLSFDWQVIELGQTRACVNTNLANAITAEAIEDGRIAELSGYETLRREVKYGANSRIDILLESSNLAPCYVEVKNVTLARNPPISEFPDSRTERGAKHLRELAEMARQGARAVMFYCVNRTDCTSFDLARDIDAAYGLEFDQARRAGVEILAYNCDIDSDGITLASPLKVVA